MEYPNPQSAFYVYRHIEAYGSISTAGIGGVPGNNSAVCPPATCPISLSQLQPGTLPAGVIIPPSAVPSPVIPPTTNTLTVAGGKITSIVNGVITEVLTSSLVNCASIKSAYPSSAGTAAASMKVLTDSCESLAIKRGVSAFGAQLDYFVVAA
jgi:hypothetical protein